MARPAGEASGIEACPAGFDDWMRAEQRRVYGMCYRLLGERDEADTATQEVFLRAYRALWVEGRGQPEEPGAWLTRVTVNLCLDRLRSRRWRFWRRRTAAESEERALLAAADAGPGPERRLLAREISARIDEGLRRLSERQRAVFVLRHYEDLSLEEIGRALGLEVGTVKAHLNRALGKMRVELRDLYAASERAV